MSKVLSSKFCVVLTSRGQVNVIGVEHTHTFSEVYDLLTTSGFEYRGLLFFDEIFVHKRPRYSWDV